MTSGNLSEEPIACANAEAVARLSGIADGFLVHDRKIESRCDDSVVRVIAGKPTVLRRSRGWVPRSIPLAAPLSEPVLACGGHLKNTFCIGIGRAAYLGPHIGDLENFETLTAYEGDRPVFVTLISSGRAGFETPPGSYRIQSKHVTATMDDTTNPDGAYSIEDVPWTMYFREGLALHAAFWHERYGEARSHGCINLSPADAHYLFDWTLPEVPDAWHGSFASRERPGTRVVIHR